MKLEIQEKEYNDPDFTRLVSLLDGDLNGRYGAKQEWFSKFNGLSGLACALVLYADGRPAACGAFKEHDAEAVEIKRVFVAPEYRRNGFAGLLLGRLEEAAKSRGRRFAVLETGLLQKEAIALYQKAGYAVTENYPPYTENENSVCMKKAL